MKRVLYYFNTFSDIRLNFLRICEIKQPWLLILLFINKLLKQIKINTFINKMIIKATFFI